MLDTFPVLDTHTGGEITRILLAGDLGLTGTSADDHLERLRADLDWVRRSLTCEPRGSEYAVGAVVAPPSSPETAGSLVFFNNVGYLGMCGHGLIGVVEALRHVGLIGPGEYEFVTPAGPVSVQLGQDRAVSFVGVPSYCFRKDVQVDCGSGIVVSGDIAYGGNWFFIAADDSVPSNSIKELMDRTKRIRHAIQRQGIRGADGAEIDHIELYGPMTQFDEAQSAERSVAGCRNFVLCPGGHYDRSPCGTGTSAKLACLAEHEELDPGCEWVQESITGSRFVASYRHDGDRVRVRVTGRAHVIAETTQVFDQDDSLRFGVGGLNV